MLYLGILRTYTYSSTCVFGRDPDHRCGRALIVFYSVLQHAQLAQIPHDVTCVLVQTF